MIDLTIHPRGLKNTEECGPLGCKFPEPVPHYLEE